MDSYWDIKFTDADLSIKNRGYISTQPYESISLNKTFIESNLDKTFLD